MEPRTSEEAPAQGDAIDEEIWLLGQPLLREYLDFVRHDVVGGATMSRAALADEWRSANDHYHELEQRERGIADEADHRELDRSLLPLVEEVTRDSRFRRTFDTLPTTFGLVELDKLVVYQKSVTGNFVDSIRNGLGPSPSPEELFRFCIPLHRDAAPVQIRRVGSRRWAFRSDSTDLRFHEAAMLRPSQLHEYDAFGPIAGVLGIVVGYGSNFLNVIRVGKRMLLHNGYHRACALRSMGLTHAPAIIQTVTRHDELEATASSTVMRDPDLYFRTARPALLKDFFDPKIGKAHRVHRQVRTVEITFEVREAIGMGLAMAKETLFREEVLAGRHTQWLGTVLLASRVSHRVFAAFAVLTTIGIVSLLVLGEYPRKVRIDGWLVPETGLVRVFAPRAGIVTDTFVHEGAEVHEGERLVALSAEVQSATLGATRTEIARRLSDRRESLRKERRAREEIDAQEIRSLQERVAMLGSESATIAGEMGLQRERVQSAERSAARGRAAREAGVATEDVAQAAEDAKLEQGARLIGMQRDRVAVERNRLELMRQLKAYPLEAATKMAAIDREISEIEQQIAEVEAQREIVVPAPASGTVTAIQVDRGGRSDGTVPLMSIVPIGAKLEAQMFCPSRAIGFLKIGQRVLLRYQAYPYQKFGHYEGVITSISRSGVSPAELPPQLSGLTTLTGTGEPVYRITVAPTSQTVTAYGRQIPLAPGMLLEADVIVERRRIGEWVLEPLHTLTGTWAR